MDTTTIIELSRPDLKDTGSLAEALEKRASYREFSEREVHENTLSALLWAAAGVNRPDGKRTSPSAYGINATDIYAVLPDGILLYDGLRHRLLPVAVGDYRSMAGEPDYVRRAYLNLIYFSDTAKYRRVGIPSDRLVFYGAAEAGHMCQNVYLYCAASGLKCITRAGADYVGLRNLLGLGEEMIFSLAQTVGY